MLDTPIVEALEHMLLLKQKEEADYNDLKDQHQTLFWSMFYSNGSNGAGHDEFDQGRATHLQNLREYVGDRREREVQEKMAEFQWPDEEVQRKAEGKI